MVSQAGGLVLGREVAAGRKARGVSLRSEVLVSLGLLMLFAIALNAALLIMLWQRDLVARRLEGLAAVVAGVQAVAPQSLRGEGQPLDLLLPQLSPEWATVAVYDAAGRLQAGSGAALALPPDPTEVMGALGEGHPVTRVVDPGFFSSQGGGRLEVCAPLKMGGRAVGVVRAVSPLEGLAFSLWGSGRLVVLFTLLDGLVIALFGSYLLRGRVVRPIERLAEAAASYTPGAKLPELEDVQGAAEIAALARGLEAMLGSLDRAASEREGYVERLEQAMRQLRAAQEELVRSEKLAVVGQLAAGVAHEIGNPIASILGYTELLAERGLTGAAAEDALRRVRQGVERIDAIVRGLLDFARPPPCEVAPLEVNPLLEEAAELVGHRKGGRQSVAVVFDLAEGLPAALPKVLADRGQLLQLLVNLMLNALDAMPDGGTLRLASREVELSASEAEAAFAPAAATAEMAASRAARRRGDPEGQDFAALRARPFGPGPARFVAIEVADTGCGIEPAALERIFDPFYTTKPPGAGTGLGLAISLRIVRSFGGTIRVQSRPGEGSTFQVLLPCPGEVRP